MAEKVTISVIKADVGSVCGHTRPHPSMIEKCKEILSDAAKQGIIEDFYVTRVGDDINLFMSHYKGENNSQVHKLGWDAFTEATKLAKQMKLYGAGQDILADAFSGNIKGAGPGSAEMSFEERPAEPVIFFMADKTEPSAYSLPLTRIFLDPFTTTGLVIDAKAKQGFDVEIHDVMDHKKVVMSSPEETLSILSLLGDTSRYAIKRISSRAGIGPLDDFDIPLCVSHTITKVLGKERVEGVIISKVDENLKPIKGTEEEIECDTLIISIGLIPENEISTEAGVKLDKRTSGAIVNQRRQTLTDGVFACGNVLHVHDIVDYVTEESENAGKNAGKYVLGTLPKTEKRINVTCSNGIKYTVPQMIDFSEQGNEKIKIYFRTTKAFSDPTVKIMASGKEIVSKKSALILPAEMQEIELSLSDIDISTCGEIKVQITEGQK